MSKSLLVLFAGACMATAPAFAQTLPGAAQAGTPAAGSAQAGAAAPGMPVPGGVDGAPAADPTAPSALGLGAVLKDAQTAHPAQGTADRDANGANRTSGAATKARKAHAQGH